MGIILPAKYLLFFYAGESMNKIYFENLDEAISCYGRENLIAIDNIKQIILYTTYGCQPKFIFENENKPGKIAAWFLKSETAYVYKKWLDNDPRKKKYEEE